MYRKRGIVLGALTLSVVLAAVAAFLIWEQNRLETEVRSMQSTAECKAVGRSVEMSDNSMATIEAGEFWMGSDLGPGDEQPRRRVSLDAYQIDRYEVTNAQYLRFLQSSGGRPPRYWVGDNYPPGQAEYPVVGISWEQASAYCQWAGKRLPTEAEWERACRGTQGQSYPWGEAWDEKRANTGSFFVSQWPERLEDGWLLLLSCTGPAETLCPRPVGSYPEGVSEAGVFDLVGNVAEWVADWYNWGGYQDLPLHNPLGLGPPWNHAVRGSAWFDRRGQEELIANVSRCAKRNSSHSSDDPRLGFRCAW